MFYLLMERQEGKIELPSAFAEEVQAGPHKKGCARRELLQPAATGALPSCRYADHGSLLRRHAFLQNRKAHGNRHKAEGEARRRRAGQGKDNTFIHKGKESASAPCGKDTYEKINNKEYQLAVASAVSATAAAMPLTLIMPIIVSDEIESLKRSKEM